MNDETTGLFERTLVEQNQGWLTAYVHAMVENPHAAEDIVQDVFMIAWRDRAKFDASRPLGAWLRGIAKNAVREHWRRAKRQAVVSDADVIERLDALAADSESGWLDPDWQERRGVALRECLRRVSHKVRQALTLKYGACLSSKAVGQRLRMQGAAVDVALSRARNFLANCMEQSLDATQEG